MTNTATSAQQDHRGRGRCHRRGPHRPRDVVVTITGPATRSAPRRPVPQPAPRGKGRRVPASNGTTSSRTSSSARPRLDLVLHDEGPRLSGQRPTSCPKRPAPRAASTWRTCWPSSRKSASPRSFRSSPIGTPIWYLPRVTVWLKGPSWDFDSNRSGGIAAINLRGDDRLSLPPACAVPKTTCCWSPHRASRSVLRDR